MSPTTLCSGARLVAGLLLVGATLSLGGAPATATTPGNGSITVVKNTLGSDGTFDFGGDLGPFELITVLGSANQTFTGLEAGTYTVTETVPPGWVLDSIVCDDGSATDVGSATATVALDADEQVTCTFTGTWLATLPSLTVIKTTETDGTFSFTGDLGAFDITTVGNSAARFFDSLEPGVYAVVESVPSGWDLESIVCSTTFEIGPGGPASGVRVTLDDGQSASCQFHNVLIPDPGTLTVVTVADGGDDTFQFGSSFGAFQITTAGGTGSFSQQVTATGHSVQQLEPPAGFVLEDISCDAEFALGPGAAEVSVTVAAGTEVTCTFTNVAGQATTPTETPPSQTSPPTTAAAVGGTLPGTR